jgi:hypothetical protein
LETTKPRVKVKSCREKVLPVVVIYLYYASVSLGYKHQHPVFWSLVWTGLTGRGKKRGVVNKERD